MDVDHFSPVETAPDSYDYTCPVAAKKAKRMLEKISAEKILGEIAMSQFNLDEEYGELMMVSGFVWILAAVFPLAPLLACLSCYVIIRGCTMKLLVSCRRPWPKKRYDIGSWCVERAPLLVILPHISFLPDLDAESPKLALTFS